MNISLEDIDILDVEDVIGKIEKSFQIQFYNNELIDVSTIGEFIDKILMKLSPENSQSCTSQKAFYMVRGIFNDFFRIKHINLDTNIAELFPIKVRHIKIKELT